MLICIISNSPTLRLRLPSSKRRSKHKKNIQNFHLFLDKRNVVILSIHLENGRGYKRELINQTSMLHNNKIKQVS